LSHPVKVKQILVIICSRWQIII